MIDNGIYEADPPNGEVLMECVGGICKNYKNEIIESLEYFYPANRKNIRKFLESKARYELSL